MNGFIEALTFALAINHQYQPPTEYIVDQLVIEYAPHAEIQSQYGSKKYAIYHRSGTIVRAQECQDENLSDIAKTICTSTLAHELVHWLDHMYQGWPETCEDVRTAESRAYYVQMHYELRQVRYVASGSRMPRIQCENE